MGYISGVHFQKCQPNISIFIYYKIFYIKN